MNLHRQRIIDVLQLFDSKSEQFEHYWPEGEEFHIPDVLLSRWEEVYRGEDQKFREGFSAEELQDLNCFYDFLLGRVGRLPKANFKALMTDIYWDSVCRFADEVLQTLAQNMEVES